MEHGIKEFLLHDDLQAKINEIFDKLPKGSYTGTATDLHNDIVAISTGVQPAGATTTNSPTGTGIASWLFAGGGTYTNYGGLVIPANHIGFITRDGSGNFSFVSFELDINLQDYAKKEILPYISNDVALYNGLVTFDNQSKTITVNNGGILSRKGGITWITGQSTNLDGSQNNDYALFVSGTTLYIYSYTENVVELAKTHFCLARFTYENNQFKTIHYCVSDFIFEGKKYKRYSVEGGQKTTSKKYCEIGDSISWQFDGKLENFASEGSNTGYRTVGGYGQKICNHFGISYDNHKSHGLNGRTIPQYMNNILFPYNSDLVYDVPQNCDIYTVFLGTNDFGKAEPLGVKADFLNDTYDPSQYPTTSTIYGGLRQLVDYIGNSTVTPINKRIVFITPIGFGSYSGYSGGITSTWEYDSNGEIVEKINSAGVKMSDIIYAIKWVANQIGACVIDLYGQNGLVQKSRLNIQGDLTSGVPNVYQSILGDNLHPGLEGHSNLGKFIISELEKIIVEDNF